MQEGYIVAYGLITRFYDYTEKYGYGCAECCNGDRCDEDCTAKYKGNRKNCPHCKGRGFIPKEEAVVVNWHPIRLTQIRSIINLYYSEQITLSKAQELINELTSGKISSEEFDAHVLEIISENNDKA